MKLHFEDTLDDQKSALEVVANLFRGQEINRTIKEHLDGVRCFTSRNQV